MPVGVESQLHPEPPDRHEQQDESRQRAKAGVLLECPGELTDSTSEDEVEEQLKPAGASLLLVVAVGSAQRRRAEPHRMQWRRGYLRHQGPAAGQRGCGRAHGLSFVTNGRSYC